MQIAYQDMAIQILLALSVGATAAVFGRTRPWVPWAAVASALVVYLIWLR